MLQKAKSKYNNIPLGIILGLVSPIIVFLLFYAVKTIEEPMGLLLFIKQYYFRSVLPNILSLCAIPNLLIFWLFLQKGRYLSSRGVIISIFLLLIWVIIEKII